MARQQHNQQPDGYLSFAGGIDGGQHPRLIGADQGAWAINCSHRGGVLSPRLGLEKHKLSFASPTEKLDFEVGGWFQGAGIHQQGTGQEDLLVSIAGKLFYIDTQSFVVTNVTPGASNEDVDWPEAELTIFTQAEDNTIISNGKDASIIFGNSGSRRADAASSEVPSGVPSAYGNGRVWVASGRQYVAGDLVGSSSGSAGNNFRDAVLKFTENTFLAEGGAFATQAGFIRGLSFMPNLDTTLGEGDLIVFTTEKVYATKVPSDRTQWRDLNYPIQRTVLDRGGENHRGVVSVNGDLYFRATDGFRSLLFARRDFSTPGNTPISVEVARLTQETERLKRFGSGVLFEDRFLHTVTPRITYSGEGTLMGVTHQSLAVLDFDPMNSNRRKAAPAWDGQWTTLPTFQILRGKERCWLFVFENDAVQLWELMPNRYYDSIPLFDTCIGVNWAWESRALDWGNPTSLKRLESFEVWLQDVRDEVTVTVDYKSDESNTWVQWGTWKEKVKVQNEGVFIDGVLQPTMYLPGYRPRRTLANPVAVAGTNVLPCRPTIDGHEFQFRLRVKGSASISRIRVFASEVQEEVYPACPPESAEETSATSTGVSATTALDGPPGVGELIVGEYVLGA